MILGGEEIDGFDHRININVTEGDFVNRGGMIGDFTTDYAGQEVKGKGRINIAANNAIFETVAFERQESAFSFGISGLTVGAHKSSNNAFDFATSSLVADQINITARENITGIGAQFVSGEGGTKLHAIDGSVDLGGLQTTQRSSSSGFSVGVTFPGSDLIDSALRGEGVIDSIIGNSAILSNINAVANADNPLALVTASINLETQVKATKANLAKGMGKAGAGGGSERLRNAILDEVKPFSGLFAENGDFNSASLGLFFV